MTDRPLAVNTVKESWNGKPLEWLVVLAEEVDAQGSQKAVGDKIGYSAAAVNQVLKNSYRGNYQKIEAAVRKNLMGQTVACPVLGEIPKTKCDSHRNRPFSAANALRVKLYRACRECQQ